MINDATLHQYFDLLKLVPAHNISIKWNHSQIWYDYQTKHNANMHIFNAVYLHSDNGMNIQTKGEDSAKYEWYGEAFEIFTWQIIPELFMVISICTLKPLLVLINWLLPWILLHIQKIYTWNMHGTIVEGNRNDNMTLITVLLDVKLDGRNNNWCPSHRMCAWFSFLCGYNLPGPLLLTWFNFSRSMDT